MTHSARALERFPIHLGLGAKAIPQPEFTGADWYQDYAARVADDSAEGRLVSLHSFTSDWPSWESHPLGEEVVICLAGEITLIQELDEGRFHSEALGPGEYLVNPAGVWHTADVPVSATVLFITPGAGTQNRAR
ncbi:cupin [Novosphingobium sp. PC22D]|uniref:cupin n=1 Tax=Novosphingobium sp. PC22D TaxID=1962403 RepID=UPI000BF21448|nr:cupin [Novosphingobium sp. PC22D]PEQ14688.1 cupin [Novosphingobium sp. PC22D]